MTVGTFVPELWAAKILDKYQGALIFGQGTVANRDYEGEIKQHGDTVHINSITDPTITVYDKTTDLVFEELSTTDQELKIDQGNSFSFYVNDVDKVQAAGDFGGAALQRASYKLAAAADQFAAKIVSAGAASANKLGSVKIVSGGTQMAGSGQITAYDLLVELGLKLSLQDVPLEGRYVVVDPNFLAATQKDDRFARVDASGSSETLRNGIVARAAGFDVLMSNNLAVVGGSGGDKTYKQIVAGTPHAFSYADQILSVKSGEAEKRFADFVKGLNVFGAKATIAEGIATAAVQSYEAGTGSQSVVMTAA